MSSGSKTFSAFRNPEFPNFIAYRFFVTNAIQMQTVICSWWMYELTKNPLNLGLIGLAEAIPSLSVSLFAGHYADRKDRRKIILVGLFALLFSSLLLWFVSLRPMDASWTGSIIYFSIFITGIGRGIMGPANFAILSQLVKKEDYANAATWNSTSWQFSSVSGPLIAGLLFNFIGISALELITSAILLLSIWQMKSISPKPLIIEQTKISIKESLKGGIRFVFSHPILLSALSLDMFAVLFGGATALLPFFANEIMHLGPEGLGYLRAAPAIGSILMMLVLAYMPPEKNAGKTLLLSVACFGLFTIFFALSQNFWLSMTFLFLTGVFDSISVVIRGTILQLFTPDEMRGRVASVNTIFIGSSNELGALESGMAASLMGTVPSVIFGGTMTLLVVFIIALKSKALRKLNLSH